MGLPSVAQETERPCLSTGHLLAREVVRKHLTAARQHLQNLRSRQSSKIEGDT
jgi:hypothetical protein